MLLKHKKEPLNRGGYGEWRFEFQVPATFLGQEREIL